MKHVGLNVAADPLFTLAYTGVRGGLVILVADDPGMHSSQNEQDSRNYAAFARVPVLEPSDSAEALAFTREAFELSERFDIPVLVRSTVRVSHTKSLVEPGERIERPEPDSYATDPAKWVMMPAMAKRRRVDLDRRIDELTAFAEQTPLNVAEYRDTAIGIVCSGVCYQHVREAMPDASTLKIGMGFPLPPQLLRDFAEKVDALYVVEEADDYLARSLRQFGIAITPLPIAAAGELTPGAIRTAFGLPEPVMREQEDSLPPRPPLMCPGCPHRPVFHTLRKKRAVVTGDIGCYTLGALKPLAAMDTCVDMGASIGMAHGAELIGGFDEAPGRRCHRRLDVRAFRHHRADEHRLQRRRGNGTDTGQPNHGDDRASGQSDERHHASGASEPRGRPRRAGASAGGRTGARRRPAGLRGDVYEALDEETAVDELSVIIYKAPCALLITEKDDPYAVDRGSVHEVRCLHQARMPCDRQGRAHVARIHRRLRLRRVAGSACRSASTTRSSTPVPHATSRGPMSDERATRSPR